ncbi:MULTISPECIES: hypothetical protein [Streptomyces]|uniref:Uncharacterized protein n=1 Tax=Streptomyces montanisoli TaxID=2798581 RepID=A0A940RXS1_9ACTN|nr:MULTISPECIES: hypothetical protein [Streptomyces]MBP0458438.1 hypothetical protein [Streptomyces montanisoli]
MQAATTLAAALATAGQQGAGTVLRVVIVVMVLGAVFLAWFLLRGYGDNGDNGGND